MYLFMDLIIARPKTPMRRPESALKRNGRIPHILYLGKSKTAEGGARCSKALLSRTLAESLPDLND
ncbi:MAG TPA: hypothetical protein DIW77_24245 [Chromatiaceae bacterium]|nr:MAG: hypothetical protein N838_28730 [Thiohalocapsa sp. PB-PSB1]HCS93056.1 hypothetical protein [Chromatiaceae bacterium]